MDGVDVEKVNERLLATRVNNAGNNAYLAAKRSHEMLTASRMYFDRAIDGHRRALTNLSVENIEAGKLSYEQDFSQHDEATLTAIF